MTKLHELFETGGQSPWIDNLTRSWVEAGGHLAELAGQGVRGVTSNPTIFAKSIESGDEYDDAMSELLGEMSVEDTYWELVVGDIQRALGVLRPLYDSSGGGDGFVSLEVAPSLARDTAGTAKAARELHERIAAPNLLVKIPATAEGLGAIQSSIAAGRSINVTLIFSLERYDEVIDAYISGLEELAATRDEGASLSDVASVASFFVSRVDTEVDRRLEGLASGSALPGGTTLEELRGKAAIAQAQLAYQLFLDRFSGARWEALASRGARPQRPLWASTSTKNPAYPDLCYVDNLIGPDSVNTMPDATLAAFMDHGTPRRTIDADPAAARSALDRLAEAGIDMADVARVLEEEGVASFGRSFDELIDRMHRKAGALSSRSGR
ncbi:MAG: transaldolase [Acidimicrobiales bacterium]